MSTISEHARQAVEKLLHSGMIARTQQKFYEECFQAAVAAATAEFANTQIMNIMNPDPNDELCPYCNPEVVLAVLTRKRERDRNALREQLAAMTKERDGLKTTDQHNYYRLWCETRERAAELEKLLDEWKGYERARLHERDEAAAQRDAALAESDTLRQQVVAYRHDYDRLNTKLAEAVAENEKLRADHTKLAGQFSVITDAEVERIRNRAAITAAMQQHKPE